MSPLVDATARITPKALPRPAYLEPLDEPEYGTRLTRIGGDTGATIPVVGGKWHSDSRHGYSRRSFWSSGGKYALMEQRSASAGPTKLILDGQTFAPILGNRDCSRISRLLEEASEVRWMPAPFSESVLFAVYPDTTEVGLFDVIQDREVWRIKVPTTLKQLMGEGNVSHDGSVVILGDESNRVMLIDLVNRRAGLVHTVDFAGLTSNHLGNLSVSSLSKHTGGKVIIKASGSPEIGRVYKFGPDLVLTPHLTLKPRLSHADTGVTLDGRDVWVGGVRDSSETGINKDQGRILAVDLETGEHWHVSAGRASGKLPAGMKEVADEHCSCRGRKGYVVTSYYASGGSDECFIAEVVEWPLDGSQVPRRYGPHRSTGSPYRAEVQPCQEPSGRRVVMASNWAGLGASPASPTSECKDYVVEIVGDVPPPPPPPVEPPPVDPGPYEVYEFPSSHSIRDKRTGRPVHPKDGADAMNREWRAAQAAKVKP